MRQHHTLLSRLGLAAVCIALVQVPMGTATAAPRSVPATRLTVASQRVALTVPAVTVRGRATRVSTKTKPAVKGRLATVWGQSLGGTWTNLGRAREGRFGWAAAQVVFPTSGAWSVRVDLARHGRVRAVRGSVREIRVRPSNVPRVTAHRGGSGSAPENTMAAFRQALREGATTLETDVQATSDGQLVLCHDATPARTTNAAQVFPGREHDEIGTFTLAELQTLDAGSYRGPEWADERIPTFDQLLALVRTEPVQLLAEAKLPVNSPGLEAEMVQQVRAARLTSADAEAQVVFESFDVASLKRIRTIDPDANVSPVRTRFPADISALSWANSITLERSATTRARVAAAHRVGLEVNVWTPNSAAEFYRFADDGVDSIITDDPRLALSTLH